MKKFVVALLMMTAISSIYAQNSTAKADTHKPKTEAEITAMKLKVLKEALMLSDDQYAQFEPIYEQYRADIKPYHHRKCRCDNDSLTDKEIKACLESSFDNAIAMATVKKQYVSKFAKVLTMRQVEKLFSMEARMQFNMRNEMDRRNGEKMFPMLPSHHAIPGNKCEK